MSTNQTAWAPGTCTICGHDRDHTREHDGDVVCLLCHEGITDASQQRGDAS